MAGRLILKRNEERRLKTGHLWIYADEVAELRVDAPGGLVHVFSAHGTPLGTAYANPESRIVARLVSGRRLDALHPAWWRDRLKSALARREWLFDSPHYRLVHGEGDRLPGLIVDRFGEDLVLQAHTAGIERHLEAILDALEHLLKPKTIYVANRAGSRLLEGLPLDSYIARGDGDGSVAAVEGGIELRCNALTGQKTGYFYDQRPNRAWMRRIARDRRVLDLFAYVGAFALQALAGGAREVVSVDSSETALSCAEANIRASAPSGRWRPIRADVLKLLPQLIEEGERFEIVICDPPAYVKSRARKQQGLRGYRKLARETARLVAPGGMLALASCSGLVSEDEFRKACLHGIREAGRAGSIVHVGGAGPDHPWNPAMPETRYLKFFVFMLD